ncbi:MAG TPA: hypothetical protein VFH68_06260 [Polyangia bacterium]|jgi:hypothetical protein|nr:hypothetical protein [Polyangia bacterium]
MLKLAAAVAFFAGFCWFGTQIPLGSHTLFGHLHAIAGTKESQDLFDGTKESAKPLVDDVRRRIAGAPDPTEIARNKVADKAAEKPAEKPAARSDQAYKSDGKSEHKSDDKSDGKSDDNPHKADSHKDAHKGEEITNSERRRLRRLISSAEASAPR